MPRSRCSADAAAHREAAAAAVASIADDGGARDAIATALGALDGRSPFTEQVARLRDLLAELDDVVGEIRDLAESGSTSRPNGWPRSVNAARCSRICDASTETTWPP